MVLGAGVGVGGVVYTKTYQPLFFYMIIVNASQICFNKHEQQLEIEAGYER